MVKVTNAVGAFIVAVFLLVGSSAPATGQVQAGLVNVNISGIFLDLALDLSDLLDVTITESDILNVVGNNVQAPIGIAANVCPDVDAAILAHDIHQTGGAECTAQQTSRAFSRLVMRNFLN